MREGGREEREVKGRDGGPKEEKGSRERSNFGSSSLRRPGDVQAHQSLDSPVLKASVLIYILTSPVSDYLFP